MCICQTMSCKRGWMWQHWGIRLKIGIVWESRLLRSLDLPSLFPAPMPCQRLNLELCISGACAVILPTPPCRSSGHGFSIREISCSVQWAETITADAGIMAAYSTLPMSVSTLFSWMHLLPEQTIFIDVFICLSYLEYKAPWGQEYVSLSPEHPSWLACNRCPVSVYQHLKQGLRNFIISEGQGLSLGCE